jgi:nitrogen fixation protein NifU and related proteins
MSDFDELYQEIIRDHYKHPRNRVPLGQDCPAFDNPSCGDRVKFMIEWEGEGDGAVIKAVNFDGSGCSISMSSTSMMTELLAGKTRAEALEIVDHFLGIVHGERDSGDLEAMGDVIALGGVIKLPVRVKCATLSWNGMKRLLSAS